jgi:hypothetical protein
MTQGRDRAKGQGNNNVTATSPEGINRLAKNYMEYGEGINGLSGVWIEGWDQPNPCLD